MHKVDYVFVTAVDQGASSRIARAELLIKCCTAKNTETYLMTNTLTNTLRVLVNPLEQGFYDTQSFHGILSVWSKYHFGDELARWTIEYRQHYIPLLFLQSYKIACTFLHLVHTIQSHLHQPSYGPRCRTRQMCASCKSSLAADPGRSCHRIL